MTRAFMCSLTLCLLATTQVLAQDGPITASGNEPFWRANVSSDDLTLIRPDFDDLSLPVTHRAQMDGYAAISAADADMALRALLLLSPEICRDTMTGMPHPQTAQLALGDQVYRGCAGVPEDLLTGGVWRVEEIGGDGVIGNSQVTLAFDGAGRVSGSGGCNRIMTGYTLTGESLSIDSAVATTMMACPDAIMNQDRAFIAALGQVEGFDIDDTGALVLRGPEGALMLARPVAD